MRKRKALKGGYALTNYAIAGPVLKEKLYQTPDENINALKLTYNEKFKEAERDLNKIAQIKKEADINYYKALKQKNSENDSNTKENEISNKQNLKILKLSGSALIAVVKSIWTFMKFIVSNIKYSITTVCTAGKGAIIKAILAILFIILVILGAINGFSSFSGVNSNNIKNSSAAGKEIFKKDSDDYINMKPDNNIFTNISDYFLNKLLPDDYKIKLKSISNSLTYITTGKNQYDDLLDTRDEIFEGRCDNIFHINFNDYPVYNKINTYSIIEPKDVLLEFNEDLYYNSDYNKIDSNIKEIIKYPQKCFIPIKPTTNSNGRYTLDIENSKYYDKYNAIISNSNLIKSILKDSDSNSKNTSFKLNSFNNKIYTNYYDANNALGTYGTRLINPNYKGPTLRLTNANQDEIYTPKENNEKNGKRTADFYYDNNTSKLYAIINDKKINYEDFFNKNHSSVVIIYDQSGNNHHLKFEKHDFLYMPEFKLGSKEVATKDDIIENYAIHFYEQHILFFTKPISYKKINIVTKIKLSIYHNFETLQYMNFLATRNQEIIKIEKTINKINFTTITETDTETTDSNKPKNISSDYLISDLKIKITEIRSNNIYYNNNPVVLECLGCAYDRRSSNEYNFDTKTEINTEGKLVLYKGKKLQDYLVQYCFKGYIYELIIYKSDD
jgi:hypothetical protein